MAFRHTAPSRLRTLAASWRSERGTHRWLASSRTGRRRCTPLIVGIGGGVAVGKSTAAAAVSELFDPGRVVVVATDGFLQPNAVLEAQGILHRKGFPESYDVAAVEAFLDAVRRARARRSRCRSTPT